MQQRQGHQVDSVQLYPGKIDFDEGNNLNEQLPSQNISIKTDKVPSAGTGGGTAVKQTKPLDFMDQKHGDNVREFLNE